MKLKDLLASIDYTDYYLIDVIVIIAYVCMFYYGRYIFKKIKNIGKEKEKENEIKEEKMRSKVKPKTLKLGDTLYFVYGNDLLTGVQKATVTTLSLNGEKEIIFGTDNQISSRYLNHSNMYITRSELKAKRVYDNLVEQQKRRELKWQTKKETYKENQKNVEEVSKNYVGKTVMVRFKGGKEESYYKKVTIDTLYPTYKKGEYSFDTKPETNNYLTTREGKNWYFWSELDELKKQKEDIEKRIKELEKEKEND